MSKLNESKVGMVTPEGLEAELMQLDKKDLADITSMWIKNYWSLQSRWMVMIERDYGFDKACEFDMEVWPPLIRTQVHRLKRIIGLGDDVQALATALKHTAPQWAPAGFAWQFLEISEKRLVMQVNKCPMGTYRDSMEMELIPCKLGSDTLYRALARAVNPKWDVVCRHAHPDPRIAGVMCEWEFWLED